jgi:hypothetical protein
MIDISLAKFFMKSIVVVCLLFFTGIGVTAAQSSLPPLDKSPMDESYCPDNFPLLKIQDKISEPLLARVVYSRPQKNGRTILGDLIEYGKLWRIGANEATEVEFFQNVKLGNTRIKKGRYTLYAIPDTGKWTVIVNKETDTWGSFRYDAKKDVARIDVPVTIQNEITEAFTIVFEKAAKNYMMNVYWDNFKLSIPFSIAM